MSELSNVTVVREANVYFDGGVTSRTVRMPDGSRKTLGIMQPGEYEFTTGAAEVMEILSGELDGSAPGRVPMAPGQGWRVLRCAVPIPLPAAGDQADRLLLLLYRRRLTHKPQPHAETPMYHPAHRAALLIALCWATRPCPPRARPSTAPRRRPGSSRSSCEDEALGDLDERLATAYQSAQEAAQAEPAAAERLLSEQKAWLAERDGCTVLPCLRRLYERRIAALVGSGPGSQTGGPGTAGGPGVRPPRQHRGGLSGPARGGADGGRGQPGDPGAGGRDHPGLSGRGGRVRGRIRTRKTRAGRDPTGP